MSALVILRPETLYVYYSDRTAPVGGSIAKSAVSDMEVVSEEELTSSVAKLVPSVPKIIVSAIIVLSDELCFIQAVEDGNRDEAETKLISATPFVHVTTSFVTFNDQSYLIATNQDYYESIARAMAVQQHQVILVIPWSCLVQHGMTKGEVDSSTVKRVFDGIAELRSCAFPFAVEKRSESVTTIASKEKKQKKIHWGWIAFGGGALLYAFFMYWFFIRGV